MLKIGAELPKLSQNKTRYPFFGPPCIYSNFRSLINFDKILCCLRPMSTKIKIVQVQYIPLFSLLFGDRTEFVTQYSLRQFCAHDEEIGGKDEHFWPRFCSEATECVSSVIERNNRLHVRLFKHRADAGCSGIWKNI